MYEGNKTEREIEVEKDPVILFFGKIGCGHSFEAHQDGINRDSVEYQNQNYPSHTQQDVL